MSTDNASVANWQAYVDSCGNDDFEPLGTDDIDIAIEYLLSNAIAVSHPAESIALLKYARLCKGIIVEIGTCAAGNTCILGLSDKEQSDRVWSIDIVSAPKQQMRLNQFGLACHLLTGTSSEWAKKWDKGPIDMMFIDGNHSEKNVYMDMDLWSKHLKSGGYYLMHDYARHRQIKRWARRGKVDAAFDQHGRLIGNGKIRSKSDQAQVHNAILQFLQDRNDFKDIEQRISLKVLQKCD